MTIRITQSFIEGTVQFTAGQVLDLPDELAQKFLDDGKAEESDALPAATPDATGFVPPSRKPGKKGRR